MTQRPFVFNIGICGCQTIINLDLTSPTWKETPAKSLKSRGTTLAKPTSINPAPLQDLSREKRCARLHILCLFLSLSLSRSVRCSSRCRLQQKKEMAVWRCYRPLNATSYTPGVLFPSFSVPLLRSFFLVFDNDYLVLFFSENTHRKIDRPRNVCNSRAIISVSRDLHNKVTRYFQERFSEALSLSLPSEFLNCQAIAWSSVDICYKVCA